ncbi:enolase-like domain-containing protein [Horticoccus sp. 23ND18S-11]|uniref:hypothetical protein n=1 Tax=Horticoccus sp. 23ND18S-11 TaxID=3391832 RepID=UPI0039C92AF1
MPAPGGTQGFETFWESELAVGKNSVAAWEARLARLDRFGHWLQRRIQSGLGTHLDLTNSDYQRCARIQRLLNEWEFCLRRLLREAISQFLREAEALRQAAAAPGASPATCATSMSLLREAAVRLEERDGQLAQISSAINGYAHGTTGREVRLPAMPNFRRVVWVDWISVNPLDLVVEELKRVELPLHTFVEVGLEAALLRSQASRSWCTRRMVEILQDYWQQLRPRITLPLLDKDSVDAVLSSLTQRYASTMTPSRPGETYNPFFVRP